MRAGRDDSLSSRSFFGSSHRYAATLYEWLWLIQGTWKGYVFAIFVTLMALTIKLVLVSHLGGQVPFLLFFSAVLLSALFGGVGPGLLAVGVTAVFADYFFLPPLGSLALTWSSAHQLIVFTVESCFFIVVAFWVRQTRNQLHAANLILSESEERLNRAQEIAHLGSWELDLTRNHLTWSDEVYRIFGLEPQQFAATYEAFLQHVHPDDRQAVDDAYGQSLREGRDTYEIEHRVIQATTGEIRWVHERCEQVRSSDGQIVRSTGMVHDITERKEAEETLTESRRQLKEASRIARTGGWSMDLVAPTRHENTLYWSDELLELLGFAPGEVEVTNDLFVELVPEEDLPRVRQKVDEAIEHDTAYNVIHRMRRKDGQMLVVQERAEVKRDAQGHPLRLVGTLQDITERWQVQEALMRSETELRSLNEMLERRVVERTALLEQRNQELQQFAFVASHDLQEPLRKVQMFADMMRSDYGADLNENANAYLSRMQNAAARMSELLRDLLSFSRMETRREPLQKVRVDDVVREVLHDLDMSIATAEAQLDVFADAEIEADRSQLRQLLNHLVMNALKFRRKDTRPVIRITTLEEPDIDGRDVCRIVVADNGIGFDMKYAERIFEPFQRLHGRSEYAGTGMGLSLCRRIAQGHGGTIRVESKPGVGSCFIIELPARQESARLSKNRPGMTNGIGH